MTTTKRILWPLGAGLIGSGFLAGFYFTLVSWVGGNFQHAIDLFWMDRWIVLPLTIGFGVQMALYTVLKKRLFVPITHTGPSGTITGASGGVSTVAMVACCAHRIVDILPFLGLTAAATFLAEYRLAFTIVGLGSMVLGISVMLFILFRERQKAMQTITMSTRLQ